MRYRNNAESAESRKDANYVYYSYKFIGVKPTSYAPFEVNGAGRSNLLRSLTLTCDMCLVDLAGDVEGSPLGKPNIGERKTFLFDGVPGGPSDQDAPDGGDTPDDLDKKKKDN